MPDYTKPLPRADEESQPFYDAARRHEFILQRCKGCGAWRYPPRLRCPECLADAFTWERASGRGRVFTFGIWHQVYHPGFAKEAPYNVTVVELEEGPHMVTNIVGCPNERLAIAMPVEVTFDDVTDEITLVKFRPAKG